jgi:DNA-binding transcriptional LysR family regulator
VRLVLADQVVNLVDDHVDAAIRIGALEDTSMIATRLGAVRRVACASPAYLEHRGTPATPTELAAHDCIMFEGLYANTLWRFGADKHPIPVQVRPRLAVNSADAAIEAAIAGAGITRVLSYQARAAVEDGRLRLILREFEPEPLPVHLMYAGQALLPLKLRAFIDFSGPRLKQRLTQ